MFAPAELHRGSPLAPLAQVNPLSAFRGGIVSSFSTRPPTGERIARLQAIARGAAGR